MTPEHWQRVKELFERALDLPRVERETLLARAMVEEPVVHKEVLTLLRNHREADSFLDSPLSSGTATGILPSARTLFEEGQVICSRYRIVRFIDRGGMGEVYEAQDLDLGVTIALKALRPGLIPDEQAVIRFKREVDLARRVAHPHVGRIFDFGRFVPPEEPEIPFLTMEFLPGETLAQRLRKSGPLSAQEAWPLILDITGALDAIHECGIVHRDFKSANVMLIQQHRLSGKVMDFGVARTEVERLDLTQTGQVPGTPAYMPPEQIAGHAGAAADIYALGIVIYEMLTGTRPSYAGIDASHQLGNAPLHWAAAVQRCLAQDPAGRFPNAAGVAAALQDPESSTLTPTKNERRRLWVGLAGAAAALALAFLAWRLVQPAPKPGPLTLHVALLQVHNTTGDPNDQLLCEGVSDTLRGQLAKLERSQKALWVIPSSDVRTISTASQAFRDVGATLVVESSFHRNVAGVSMEIDLVDPQSHRVLNSETIQLQPDDIASLPDRAVPGIARLLDLQMDPSLMHEVASSAPHEAGAFEFYEQGVGYLQREGVENADLAIGLFRQALQKDSRYALAYAGLGEALAKKYVVTREKRFIEEASASGQKAVALNAELPEVQASLGKIYELTGQPQKAIQEFQAALARNPALEDCSFTLGEIYADEGKWELAEHAFKGMIERQPGGWMGYSGLAYMYARHGGMEQQVINQLEKVTSLRPDSALAFSNLGGAYMRMGKYAEAVPPLQKSISIQPRGENYSNLGSALMYLHRYEEAATAMERATQIAPHNHDNWRNLGDSYRQISARRGEADHAYRRALDAAAEQLRVNPRDPDVVISIALYYAHLGNRKRAVEFAERAIRLAPSDNGILFTAALTYELAGNRENALKLLAEANKAGYSQALIAEEPELEDLRKDPKFAKTLKDFGRVPRI